MDKDYEAKYHNIEENNWWFLGRRDAILKLLSDKNKYLKILDIGCSGGALLSDLKKKGFENLSGLDISEKAIELCKEKGFDNVFVMDGSNPSFDENSFDIIIASDSLEHIKDDMKSLKNWNKILKPNGELYVFVPAFMYLWSEHDIINHHFRRYTAIELKSKMERSHFNVIKFTYWNFCMYFPTTIYRLTQSLKNKLIRSEHAPKDQLKDFNPSVNSFLIKLIKFENFFFKRMGLPIGVSAYVKGQKSNS